MTTVELDSLLANQEFQQLLEAAEQSGSVRHAELAEVLEPHELGLLETDAVEPAPRRLDREELPQPGVAVPRSDPGGHPRADPRGREIRLAPWLQVLDLRDLVDSAGRCACAGRQGADDPDARAHRRTHAEA